MPAVLGKGDYKVVAKWLSMAYNTKNMSERKWESSSVDESLFCADTLASGATLFWAKGVNSLTGRQRFSVSMAKEGSLEFSKLNIFSVETHNGLFEIIQSQISVSGGEINLWYSGAGELGYLSLIKFPNNPGEQLCQIGWDLITGKIEAIKPSGSSYYHGEDGVEIRQLDNRVGLGIYPLSDQKLQVMSDGWKHNWWTIVTKPISLTEQVVLSPRRWGNSAESELVARTVDKIISQRVIQFGV